MLSTFEPSLQPPLIFLYSQIKSHCVYVLHIRGHLAASIMNTVNRAEMLPVQGQSIQSSSMDKEELTRLWLLGEG